MPLPEAMENVMSRDANKLSRREGLQVAAGVLALGAGLGVTRLASGREMRLNVKTEAADRVQIKWYVSGPDNKPRFVQAASIPAEVVEAIYNGAGSRVMGKWFRGPDAKATHVGTMTLPAEVRRLRR